HPRIAVDGGGLVAQMDGDAVLFVEALAHQTELLSGSAAEEGGQADAVVGDAGFFAEGDDLPGLVLIPSDQLLDEAVADHAVADDDQGVGGYHALSLAQNVPGTEDAWRSSQVSQWRYSPVPLFILRSIVQ